MAKNAIEFWSTVAEIEATHIAQNKDAAEKKLNFKAPVHNFCAQHLDTLAKTFLVLMLKQVSFQMLRPILASC